MDAKILRETVVKNLWLFFKIPFLACFGILAIAALLFPTAGLSAREACKPIEMLLPFVGVVTFVPVFLPEQDMSIYDTVACRRISPATIYLIRLILAVILETGFVAVYCLWMKRNECNITLYMVWGGMASGFFMGSIGFFAAGITGNVLNGFLASMIYYICNYGLKSKLGVFYLFRMSAGIPEGKIWLLAAGLLLLSLTFLRFSLHKFSVVSHRR